MEGVQTQVMDIQAAALQEEDNRIPEVADAPPSRRQDQHDQEAGTLDNQVEVHSQVEDDHNQVVVRPYHNQPEVGKDAHTLVVELRAGRHTLVERHSNLDVVEGNHMGSVEDSHREAARDLEVGLPNLSLLQEERRHWEVEGSLDSCRHHRLCQLQELQEQALQEQALEAATREAALCVLAVVQLHAQDYSDCVFGASLCLGHGLYPCPCLDLVRFDLDQVEAALPYPSCNQDFLHRPDGCFHSLVRCSWGRHFQLPAQCSQGKLDGALH